MFSFSEEENLYESATLKLHGATVVKTVGVAVTGLKSLNDLVPTLQSLGRRHQKYGEQSSCRDYKEFLLFVYLCRYTPSGVVSEHYEVVGKALIMTLRAALGEKFTPEVESVGYHLSMCDATVK